METGLGGWAKRGKGLRSTDWQLQNSHGGVKHSPANRVNNPLVTKCLSDKGDGLGRGLAQGQKAVAGLRTSVTPASQERRAFQQG